MMIEQQKRTLEPPKWGLQGNHCCYNDQAAVITAPDKVMARFYRSWICEQQLYK